MSFYKTYTDISNEFRVAKTTVTRWVEGALEGKNNLQIERSDKKVEVLKNEHNFLEMTKLKAEGSKYRGNAIVKETEPSQLFYDTFSDEEVIEIIHSLEIKKEVPRKYCYRRVGAELWDKFILDNEPIGKYPTGEKLKTLLHESFGYINYKLRDFTKVNLIDIGPGNAFPVKETIERLIKENKLNKYIAIDISEEMLDICEKNIKTWFPQIQFERYLGDAETVNLSKICFSGHSDGVVNLILYLGSTIGYHKNQSKLFDNIHSGIEKNDLFIYSNTIDNEKSRSSFVYAKDPKNLKLHTWIAEEIGIDIPLIELVATYSEEEQGKLLELKLDKDYTIKFVVGKASKIVNLYKGDCLRVWRMHMTNMNTFSEAIVNSGMRLSAVLTDKEWTHTMVISEPIS